MKRIPNTELWTDGVVTYKRNAQGDFQIHIQETAEVEVEEPKNVVEIDEPVVLKPIDNEEE